MFFWKSKNIAHFNKNIYLLKSLISSHSNHQNLIHYLKFDPYESLLPILLKSHNKLYRSIHHLLGNQETLQFYIEERIRREAIYKNSIRFIYPLFIFFLGLFMIVLLNIYVLPYVHQYLDFEFKGISKLTGFYLGLLIGLILLSILLSIYFLVLLDLKKFLKHRHLYEQVFKQLLTFHLLNMSLFLHRHQVSFLDSLKILQNSPGILGVFFKEAYLKLNSGIDFSHAYSFIDSRLLDYIVLEKEAFDYQYLQEFMEFYMIKINQKLSWFVSYFRGFAFIQMAIIILIFYTIVLSPLTNLERIL